ncbi:ATP-binding protein [Thiomicrorhabdus lithotrophica]|uniref:ATP-binding protein n=1 Tax=Thiomicrorhabdus lithotrophica TaxID=2949997 RepID=A0ABY8CER7_9GAMM|nr:ATP-binding protein [Thiomicrorhabdus lithotrophica]WEJ62908.1 ATP-binding protein [Thiomicrorhabdus lithotrophica]
MERQNHIQASLDKGIYFLTFCSTVTQAVLQVKNSPVIQYDALIIDESALNQHDLTELKSFREYSCFGLTPFILQVNNPQSDAIQKGFDLGMYFYLIYPFKAELLNTVILTATLGLSNHQEISKRLANFEIAHPRLQKAVFHIQTVSEAQAIASVLAYMTPDQKRIAIGLFELILNSIEHGNLGIGYKLKSQLITNSKLQTEVTRRLSLEENSDKFVTVTLERKTDFFEFTISDNGAGFNYTNFLDFEENRATDSHGRGIMIANRLSFDYLEYRDSGSTVICRVNT